MVPLDGNELDENGQTRDALPGRCISSLYVLPTGRCISRYVYTNISWVYYISVFLYVGVSDKVILMYRPRWPSVGHLLFINVMRYLALIDYISYRLILSAGFVVVDAVVPLLLECASRCLSGSRRAQRIYYLRVSDCAYMFIPKLIRYRRTALRVLC
jgi:hypothetical protein